jgi:hypothetical protein
MLKGDCTMHRPKLGGWLFGLVTLAGLCTPQSALCAVPNSLVLNEVNMVSGDVYLDKGRGDPAFGGLGRVQGNGQNWLEFLVVQGDAAVGGGYKNTLDLRGWTIDWSYDKDHLHTQFGAGTIQFTQDPLWATVPRGSLITMSEWQDAWYEPDPADVVAGLPLGGLKRDGGINGLGHLRGAAYNSSVHAALGATSPGTDPHVLHTDTAWNPAKNGGGYNGDWRIHVFAGEQNPNQTFKYFNFSGSITTTSGTYAIGTDDGGLFAANNDEWQYTIKDAQGNIIQAPIGEHLPGSSYGVNPNEISRLEAFSDRFSLPTQAQYLGATIANYTSGSTSTFGARNIWSSGDDHQGLLALRDWLHPGDADLDGSVTAADYVVWRKNAGSAGDWRDGDFSGDGMVDTTDYNIWRTNFGAPIPGSGAGLAGATVPEPQACALFAMATITIVIRRARNLMRRR